MMHLYSTLLYIVVHQRRFTIMWGGGGGSHSTTTNVQASTWMMRRLPQAAPVRLQVEMRESHRANQVDALATHQATGAEEREHRANQVYALTHT